MHAVFEGIVMNTESSASTASEYSRIKASAYALFVIGFVLGYFYFMGNNIAIFTYFPETMEFRLGTVKMPDSGPGMTWYGWIGYAALTGLACSLLAFIPGIRKRLSDSRWASAAAAIAVVISLVLIWFYRKDFI